MSGLRSPAEQRALLAETIRNAARWREAKAKEFADDHVARKRSGRAAHALRYLAKFVATLPDDDQDLKLSALIRVKRVGNRLDLSDDASYRLSRFGMDQGAWQEPLPTEAQMRNLIRRLNGDETRERAAEKLRAEAGYGEG